MVNLPGSVRVSGLPRYARVSPSLQGSAELTKPDDIEDLDIVRCQKLGRLKGPRDKYGFLFVLARAPGLREPPETPKAIHRRLTS